MVWTRPLWAPAGYRSFGLASVTAATTCRATTAGSSPSLTATAICSSKARRRCSWRFTLNHSTPHSEAAAALWAEIDAATYSLLTRAQREGLLAPSADLQWISQVYYALLSEALNKPGVEQNPSPQDLDTLATLVIDTLLHGAGRDN